MTCGCGKMLMEVAFGEMQVGMVVSTQKAILVTQSVKITSHSQFPDIQLMQINNLYYINNIFSHHHYLEKKKDWNI